MKPLRFHSDVINDWAAELSVRLNRCESDIRQHGLSALDFSSGSSVEVREPSGLVHRVNFAFALIRPAAAEAAVFSEHAGYLEFALEEDAAIVEIAERTYRHGS